MLEDKNVTRENIDELYFYPGVSWYPKYMNEKPPLPSLYAVRCGMHEDFLPHPSCTPTVFAFSPSGPLGLFHS